MSNSEFRFTQEITSISLLPAAHTCLTCFVQCVKFSFPYLGHFPAVFLPEYHLRLFLKQDTYSTVFLGDVGLNSVLMFLANLRPVPDKRKCPEAQNYHDTSILPLSGQRTPIS